MWWWLACTTSPDPGEGWTGETIVAPDPVPARFHGPLSLAFGPEDRPLEPLRHGVCHDRPGAREALLGAIAETASEARSGWGVVTGDVDCDDPGFCAWVNERLSAAAPEEADLWRVALWSCRDEVSARRLLDDAPIEVVGAYVGNAGRHGRLLPWTPRFGELVTWALAEDPLAEDALRGVAALPDPQGRALLRRTAEGLDGDRRDRVYAALDGTLDPAEALLVERACAALGRTGCVGRAALADLPAAVAAGFDVRALPGRYPNLYSALRGSLTDCVVDGDPFAAHACAEALASFDVEAAAAAVASSPWASELRDVRVVPQADASLALSACGLPVPDDAAPTGATYADLLVAGGHALHIRAVSIDDTGPGLQYRLAHLAGLDDAEFGLLAPPALDGPRAFQAWSGGVRHHLGSPSSSGWDVGVGTRLVNALLAAAEREERFVPDATWTVWVLAGPDARRCLAREGLVTFAEAPAPDQVEP